MIALIVIFFLTVLIFYLAFVYTAHKDYKERKENPGHTPHTYNKNGEFSYKPNPHPLFSPKPRDDIFLSLVFPAYNEEKRLAPALERTVKFFSQKQFKYEIIIVNDGSKDRTFELIKQQMKLYNNVEIIGVTYDKNGGKGYAVRTGMQYVRGEFVLMLDSDGATDIRDYDRLYESIKEKGCALAIGSRKIITEKANRVWYRNIMGVINNFIVRTLIGIGEIKDTQCGFKLFTKEAAQIIFGNLHLVRWAFDVDMLYICKKRNIYIKEVPVTWEEVAGSKLMLLPATISFFRDYFAMLTFYNTGFWTYNREQSLISAN